MINEEIQMEDIPLTIRNISMAGFVVGKEHEYKIVRFVKMETDKNGLARAILLLQDIPGDIWRFGMSEWLLKWIYANTFVQNVKEELEGMTIRLTRYDVGGKSYFRITYLERME